MSEAEEALVEEPVTDPICNALRAAGKSPDIDVYEVWGRTIREIRRLTPGENLQLFTLRKARPSPFQRFLGAATVLTAPSEAADGHALVTWNGGIATLHVRPEWIVEEPIPVPRDGAELRKIDGGHAIPIRGSLVVRAGEWSYLVQRAGERPKRMPVYPPVDVGLVSSLGAVVFVAFAVAAAAAVVPAPEYAAARQAFEEQVVTVLVDMPPTEDESE